jgi:hypothetical protein
MLVENGYMSVDQVWRGKPYELVLALEHENVGREANEVLSKEVAHLIDLRARLKVGIFYPNTGDERTLMNGISLRISNAAGGVQIPGEQYMFILGFTTRKQGQPAIRFNAYILDERGIETVHREQVILQAPKPERSAPVVGPCSQAKELRGSFVSVPSS